MSHDEWGRCVCGALLESDGCCLACSDREDGYMQAVNEIAAMLPNPDHLVGRIAEWVKRAREGRP